MTPENTNKLKSPWYFYGAAIVLGMMVAVGISELYFRLFEPQPLYNECHTDNWPSFVIQNKSIGYSFVPNLRLCKYNPDTNQRINWSTNGAGLRMKQRINIQKPVNTTRILLVGDSFVEGSDVDDAETIAVHLDKLLPKQYEVINMGRGSTATAQQFAFFKEVGKHYSPDIVVLFFYPNDFYGNINDYPFYDITPDGKLNMTAIINPETPQTARYTRNWFTAFMTRRSHTASFFHRVYEKYSARKYYSATDLSLHTALSYYPKEIQYPFQITIGLFEEFDKVVKQNNATFVVVYIPTRYQLDFEHAKELLMPLEREKIEKFRTLPHNPNVFFSVFFANSRIPYIDLLYEPAFAQNWERMYFRKNIHTTGEGNGVIAWSVYESLVKNEIIPSKDLVGRELTRRNYS